MVRTEIELDSSNDEKEMYHVDIHTDSRGKIKGLFEKSEIRSIIERLDNGVHH